MNQNREFDDNNNNLEDNIDNQDLENKNGSKQIDLINDIYESNENNYNQIGINIFENSKEEEKDNEYNNEEYEDENIENKNIYDNKDGANGNEDEKTSQNLINDDNYEEEEKDEKQINKIPIITNKNKNINYNINNIDNNNNLYYKKIPYHNPIFSNEINYENNNIDINLNELENIEKEENQEKLISLQNEIIIYKDDIDNKNIQILSLENEIKIYQQQIEQQNQ